MSARTVMAFAERMSSDSAFRDHMVAAPNAKTRLRLAREAGFDLSLDDLAEMESSLGTREVSDDDLDDVAGGAASVNSYYNSIAPGSPGINLI